MNPKSISQKAIDLAIHFECGGDIDKYLESYNDGTNVFTIGIGTTIYPNGRKVEKGQKISIDEAYEYYKHDILQCCDAVSELVKSSINQDQFDSLTDFAYNCGIYALKNSTLLKKINSNPSNPEISQWFEAWDKADTNADGKLEVVDGLLRRRKSEYYLYSTGELKFYFP